MGLVIPWPVGSSPTRDWTHVPCIGRQIFIHWTTREVPISSLMPPLWMKCLCPCGPRCLKLRKALERLSSRQQSFKDQVSSLCSWFFQYRGFKKKKRKNFFKLKDNCFTIFCWFLPCININQPLGIHVSPPQYRGFWFHPILSPPCSSWIQDAPFGFPPSPFLSFHSLYGAHFVTCALLFNNDHYIGQQFSEFSDGWGCVLFIIFVHWAPSMWVWHIKDTL